MNSILKTSILAACAAALSIQSCKKGGDGNGTGPKASAPTVTTAAPTAVTQSGASSGGTVTADGGASVSARGVCFGTAQNPTTADAVTSDGAGTGAFASSLSGLAANTYYYVRAYATNSAGTGYGSQVALHTAKAVVLPSLSIVTASAYDTAAVVDFKVTDAGNGTIAAAGVCWGTAQNPTIAGSKTVDGTGVGEFIASAGGLAVNVTYYLRAYATNGAGTAYSDQVSFTTAYRIGQNHAGGLIFYIDGTKVHGLVVSKEDQSRGAVWDNASTSAWIVPGAYSTADGSGNTADIVAAFGTGANAAAICGKCRDGGYADWFLPALSQLTLIQSRASLLYPDTTVPGVFGASGYWSSTESSGYVAYAFYLNVWGSTYNSAIKTTGYSVRAIRAF